MFKHSRVLGGLCAAMTSVFVIAATGCGSHDRGSNDEETSEAPVTTGVPAQISITDGTSSVALVNDGQGHLATQTTYPDGTVDQRVIPSGGSASLDTSRAVLTVNDPQLGSMSLNVVGGTYNDQTDVFQVQLTGNGTTQWVTLTGFGLQDTYHQLVPASMFAGLGAASLHTMANPPVPPQVYLSLLQKIITICAASWVAFGICVAVAIAAAIAIWYMNCRSDIQTAREVCLASGGIPGSPIYNITCSVACNPKCAPAGGAKITASTCPADGGPTSDGGTTTDGGTTADGGGGSVDSGVIDAAVHDAATGG